MFFFYLFRKEICIRLISSGLQVCAMLSKLFANMNIGLCALFEFGRTDLGHKMHVLLWRFGACISVLVICEEAL